VLGAWLAQRKSPAMYDAMNRHDVEGVLANLADDVTFVFPGDVWASGTFVGKKAVGEWFERFFQQFSTIHFAVQWVVPPHSTGVRCLVSWLRNAGPSGKLLV